MRRKLPIFFLAATLLKAAPDPDIFDGRVVSQEQSGGSQSSTSGSGATEASGGSAAEESSSEQSARESSDTGSESSPGGASGRDFNEIGQVGSEQSVSTAEAKPPAPGGAPSVAGSSGGSASGEPSSSGGSPGASGTEVRDFSEIGGISSTGNQKVDVNSSKTSPAQTTNAVGHSPDGSNTSRTNQGQGTGSGSSQPSRGSGSGDIGETLPSGI